LLTGLFEGMLPCVAAVAQCLLKRLLQSVINGCLTCC